MNKQEQIKVYTIDPVYLNGCIEVKQYTLDNAIKTTEMNFLYQTFLTWCKANNIEQDISNPLNGIIKVKFWKNKDKEMEDALVKKQLEDEQEFNGNKYKFYATSPSMLKENLGIFLREDCYDFEKYFNIIIALGHYPSEEEEVNISKDIIARVSLATTGTKRTNLVPRICIVDMHEYKYIVDYYSSSVNEEGEISTTLYKAGELDIEKYKHEAQDGCGLISKDFIKKVGEDLDLSYTPSWLGVRQYNGLACKGVLTSVDYIEYANEFNGGNTIITDVFGHEIDLRDIDIIYNTSMAKWWKHFKDKANKIKQGESKFKTIYEYINARCDKKPELFLNNLYVSKYSKEKTKDARTCYQFLQQLALTEKELLKLYSPTAKMLKGILSEDKPVIQIAAGDIFKEDEEEVAFENIDFIKRLNVLIGSDDELMGLTKVRQHISKLALTKLKELKAGRTYIKGAHFKTLISDPIDQLNYIFGLDVENTLGVREYFVNGEENETKVTIARFPLNLFSEIRNVAINSNITDVYRRYLGHLHKDCIVFNAKDDTSACMSGADFDLDMCYYVPNNPTIYNAVIPPMDEIDYKNIEDGNVADNVKNTKENYVKSVMNGKGNLIGSIALGASKIAARQQAIPYFVNGKIMNYLELEEWIVELNKAGEEVDGISIREELQEQGYRKPIRINGFIGILVENGALKKYEDVVTEEEYREYMINQFYKYAGTSYLSTGIGMKAIDAPKTGNPPTEIELKACDLEDEFPYFMRFAKDTLWDLTAYKTSNNLSETAYFIDRAFKRYEDKHSEGWYNKDLPESVAHLYKLIMSPNKVDDVYYKFIDEAYKLYNASYKEEVRMFKKQGIEVDRNKLRDEAVCKYISEYPELNDSQKIVDAIVKRDTGSTFIINYFFKHLEGKITRKYSVEPCELGEEDVLYLEKPYRIVYLNSKRSDDLNDVFTPIRLKEVGNIFIKLADGVKIDDVIGKEFPHANMIIYDGKSGKIGQYYKRDLGVLKDSNVLTITGIVETKAKTFIVSVK